jgi:hypothetical protein
MFKTLSQVCLDLGQCMVCNGRLGSYKNENDFWKTRLACYQAVWAATKLALGSSSSQVR